MWAKGEKRPSWVLPCLRALGTSVVCLGIHSTLHPMVPDSAFVEDWFLKKGLGFKIGYIYLLGVASARRPAPATVLPVVH